MRNDALKKMLLPGRYRRLSAAAIVATLVAWAATAGSMAPAKDEKPKPAKAVVPFEMLESNHMLISAKINGDGPYKLIFDLGAPFTLLGNSAAEKSKTVKRDAPRGFLGMRGEATIKKLELGTLADTDVPVMVFDHPVLKMLGDNIGRRLDGIIGYTFFAHYRTTIDYKEKTITFEPVDFQVGNLVKDLEKRLAGPKVARVRVLSPAGLWGFSVGDPAGGLDAAGVPVVSVKPGSPAEAAGLQADDILTVLDGRWTTSINDTYAAAAIAPVGRAVSVIVLRKGKELTLSITPREGF